MLELSHVECEHEHCSNAFPLVIVVEEVGDDQVVGLVGGVITVMVQKGNRIFGKMYAVFLTRSGLFTKK